MSGIEDRLRDVKHDRFVIKGNSVNLERRYGTLSVNAEVNTKTKNYEVNGKITGLGWIVALLFAPIGTVYYFVQKNTRVNQMKQDIEDMLG